MEAKVEAKDDADGGDNGDDANGDDTDDDNAEPDDNDEKLSFQTSSEKR